MTVWHKDGGLCLVCSEYFIDIIIVVIVLFIGVIKFSTVLFNTAAGVY